MKLKGEECEDTVTAANNYAMSLVDLRRFKEARALLRKAMPVARRVYGKSDGTTIRMMSIYADALREDPAATLDDLREAVTTLEDAVRTTRRVFGGANPLTMGIASQLEYVRAVLRARETPSPSA